MPYQKQGVAQSSRGMAHPGWGIRIPSEGPILLQSPPPLLNSFVPILQKKCIFFYIKDLNQIYIDSFDITFCHV